MKEKNRTALNKENLSSTVKHGCSSIIVWGYIAACLGSQLQHNTMIKWEYLIIFKTDFQQSATKLSLRGLFSFHQGNDSKHTADIVKRWLLYNAPKHLRTPPQSLDLNTIQRLWYLLEKKVRNHNIKPKSILTRSLPTVFEFSKPKILAQAHLAVTEQNLLLTTQNVTL